MTAALDQRTADRLAKLLGMLGSDQAGERAAAAAKADQLIRQHGLQWADVVAPATASTSDTSVESIIDFALAHGRSLLTDWEVDFLHGVRSQRKPVTQNQIRKLRQIAEKVASKGYSS